MNSKTIALALAALFVAAHLFLVVSGDTCPIHGSPHGCEGVPNHAHEGHAATACLCFSGLLFSPPVLDLGPQVQALFRLDPAPALKTIAVCAFDPDRPPRLLFA